MQSFAELREKANAFDFGNYAVTPAGAVYVAAGHNGQRMFSPTELPRTIPPFRSEFLASRPNVPVIITEDLDLADTINAHTDDVVATGPAPQLFGRTNWTALQGRDVVIVQTETSFKITARNAKAKLLAFGSRLVAILDNDFLDLDGGIQAAMAARKDAAREAKGPDLTLLHKRVKAVPTLPAGLLGTWANWAKTISSARATAPEYILAGLLGSVAGIVTGRIGVQVQTAWKEEAPLWMIAIGPSGRGKTQGLNSTGMILEMIEADLTALHKLAVDAWKQGGKQGPRPPLESLRTFDSTPEAAGVKLARLGRGLIFWFEEATGLFNGLGRYGNETERSFYIRLHDAKPATIDRRNLGDDPLVVNCLGGSIVGGAQPDIMRAFLNSDEDGAKARMIYLWPSEVSSKTAPIADKDWQDLVVFAADALRFLVDHVTTTANKTYIPLSHDGQARFLAWRDSYLAALERRHGDEIPSALAKGPGMVARIALALALLDGATTRTIPGEINDDYVHRAIDLWDILVQHRAKVELDAFEPQNERVGRLLAQHIAESGVEVFNVAALRRASGIPELRQHTPLIAALVELEEAGWWEAGTRIPRSRNQPLPDTLRLRKGLAEFIRTRSR
jgi:hypothetical protein